MNTKAASIVLHAVVLVTACVYCFYSGKKAAKTAIEIQTDTLRIYDTIERIRPVYVRERVIDTLLVPVSCIDTIILRDSFFIQLPKQEKVYEDSLYYAVVSGFRPSLDSIRIFAPTIYIKSTERIAPPQWGFGVSAGPSALVDLNGRVHAGIGVSAGIYYRF